MLFISYSFHREDLVTVFENIEEACSSGFGDQTTLHECRGFLNFLDDQFNIILLEFFNNILLHVEHLFNILQKRCIDVSTVNVSITNFTTGVNKIRNTVVPILIQAVTATNSGSPAAKRRRLAPTRESLTRDMNEVCDIVLTQCQDRFKQSGHLVAASLLNKDNFKSFSMNFPTQILKDTVISYPFFEERRLKSELTIIYSNDEFSECAGPLSLLNFLKSSNLIETYSSVSKLCNLLITIPMTSTEAERKFSTLKRIKTFLRNSMLEDRLNALAMLSMEKSLVRNSINFNTQVIERFAAQKDRRAKFLYK